MWILFLRNFGNCHIHRPTPQYLIEILLFLFHWHVSYLAFAFGWKHMNAWSGATVLQLLCGLLWSITICSYAYTVHLLVSLVSVPAEKGPIAVLDCVAQHGTSSTGPALFPSCRTSAWAGGAGEAMPGRALLSLSAGGRYPVSSLSLPVLFYITVALQQKQRADRRIKSQLLWKSMVCGSIWSSGRKLKKYKNKKLIVTQQSKLM